MTKAEFKKEVYKLVGTENPKDFESTFKKKDIAGHLDAKFVKSVMLLVLTYLASDENTSI